MILFAILKVYHIGPLKQAQEALPERKFAAKSKIYRQLSLRKAHTAIKTALFCTLETNGWRYALVGRTETTSF
jgi:hypothetical protein